MSYSYNPYLARQSLRPVWQTREELEAVLDQYRAWYAEGLTDVEISFRIRTKYVVPHNGPPRGKRR